MVRCRLGFEVSCLATFPEEVGAEGSDNFVRLAMCPAVSLHPLTEVDMRRQGGRGLRSPLNNFHLQDDMSESFC